MKIKNFKRSGIKGKQKYSFVTNGVDCNISNKVNDVVLYINKTKEIQELLIKHKKYKFCQKW